MKTIAHDNTTKGISYDNNCALYLDGKRLLLKSGLEGTDGCVYAPEGNPLTSVTLHYSLSSTLSWFEIDTNDGMIYEYGHNGGQQLVSTPSGVAAWHLTKATNAMGQTITYQYSSDGLYLYPQTISYGGDNTINFTYENRSDSVFFVLRNNRGYVAKRLKTIATRAGGDVYRTYTMTYNTVSDGTAMKFSRLVRINETGENGIGYHDMTAQWNYLPSVSETCQQSVVSVPSSNSYVQYNGGYLLSGDLNNNGTSDIIYVAKVTNAIGTYVSADVYKSQVNNGTVSFELPIRRTFSPDINIGEFFFDHKGRSFVVDINGDGRQDLVFPRVTNVNDNEANTLYFEMSFSEESDNVLSPVYTYGPITFGGDDMPLYSILDLKGDGRNEIVVLERQGNNGQYTLHLLDYAGSNSPAYTIGLTLQSDPKHLFSSDFNHDGLTDLMVVSDNGYRIFYNQGGTSLQNLFVNSSTLRTSFANHDRIEPGDFNGDGILDFIWNDNNSNQLYFELGNADGTFTRCLAYNLDFNVVNKNNENGTWNCLVTDLDHDGKSDAVLSVAKYFTNFLGTSFIKTYTYWFHSNGTTLTKKKEATSSREDDARVGRLFAGDFKGNGYFDVANYGYDCYNGTDADVDPMVNIYSCGNHSISNGKIAQFCDSNGRISSFTHAPMTSNSVYTKGTGSSYPLLDVVAPLCVTSKITESGASPITTQTNYTYKGLRTHLQGRGLLGFSETTATETNSGKEVKTTVKDIDPTYYVPTRTKVSSTQGGMTASTETLLRLHNSSNSANIPNGNYLVLQESKVERDIYNTEIVTNQSYDDTHYYLSQELISDNGGSVVNIYDYSYSQNKIAGAYRPVSVILTKTHCDDDEPFVKETQYTYDNYGRTISMTEFPEEELELVTTYQYDSYGNVTKEKQSGYGVSNDTEKNYQYSSNGKFLTQESNIAKTVSYEHNVFGDIVSETDLTNVANPLTTTYTRNGFGTLTRVEKPTGEFISWFKENTTAYGGCYLVTAMSNSAPTIKTWNDALGTELRRETTGINDVEISATNTYNTQGELTTKTSVHGSLTTTENYTYDATGRLTAFTSSNGTSETYYCDDYQMITTKNGQAYTKCRDQWGNVVEIFDPVSSMTYYYDAIGKPKEIETENGIVQIEYDDYGNQVSLDDPDAGLTTYEYDALHRLISQTDARGYVTTFSYDGAGRMTQKTVDGTTTSYTYGTSGNGAGKLVSEQTDGCTITYTYDNKGRLSQETRSMTGEPLMTFSYSYGVNGLLTSKTYPQGVTVYYYYDNGRHIATKMGSTDIWQISQDNGRKKEYSVGGVMNHRAEYDARGYLTKLATERDSMTFSFQSGTANLLSRTGMTSQMETFTYDSVDRLTQVSGGATQSVGYYNDGNISEKTEPGVYSYGVSHPHAVSNVTNPLGSISSATQTAAYTPFGKIETLSDNGYTLSLTYGPDEERWKTVLHHNGSTVLTTLYADGYERITENGQTRHFYYLDGGVIYVLNDGSTNGTFYYTFTDHLGSITRIYNNEGTKVFSAEYDAWGKQDVSVNTLGFRRGYTGHEMLPEFGLVNMNGRLYDPILGRFLSPDNYVQMPDFSQSFNRYSYCLNNPLKYTDPDGELAWFVVAAIVGGTLNAVANYDNIDNFWDGFKYFGVGAAAGVLSAGIGSGVNVAMAGRSFISGFMGTATGVTSTGFISGMLTGASSGFVGSFITEAGNSWIAGESFGSGLQKGLIGGGTSALIAGAINGVRSGFAALNKGANFWTGSGSFNMSEVSAAHGFVPGEETITGKYVGEFEGIHVFESKNLGNIKRNYGGITIPERGIIVGNGVFTSGSTEGIAMMQHEFGHILQYRETGMKAYYKVIAPESISSALYSKYDSAYSHDLFWTETWANYLSKNYFGTQWLGTPATYPANDISTINKIRLIMAKFF